MVSVSHNPFYDNGIKFLNGKGHKKEKIVKGKKKLVPEKERYPVVTIVLYFGEKAWQYPLELKNNFLYRKGKERGYQNV